MSEIITRSLARKGAVSMLRTIQMWGNSRAIRLPKGILEEASMRENDTVRIYAEPDRIVIKRDARRHRTLQERLTG
jgi:antitoxin MazE